MKPNQEILNRISGAEDAARQVRENMRHRTTAVVPGDIKDLADAVAQGLQAVREALQNG